MSQGVRSPISRSFLQITLRTIVTPNILLITRNTRLGTWFLGARVVTSKLRLRTTPYTIFGKPRP